MATPKATTAQIKLASQGKGRITKTGRYQSSKEVQRRAVQEQRRQLSRSISRIETERDELRKSGSLSKQELKNVNESLSYMKKQLDTITTSLPKPKSTKGMNKQQRNRANVSYTKMLEKIVSNIQSTVDFSKTQTARSLTRQKSRYTAHSKKIWHVIYKYTFGDVSMGEGVWDSNTPYTVRKKKIREYVRNELNKEREKQGVKPYSDKYYPSNDTVFNFFQQRFKEQYKKPDYDIVDDIISDEYGDSYTVEQGGVAAYLSKGAI